MRPRPQFFPVRRVLIADRDADTRALYAARFRQAGCDVVEAEDGRDALVKALTHEPSLVITDTHLPIIDGIALCEVLRRDVLTRGVPILVIASDAREHTVNRARAAGADTVLVKPAPLDTVTTEATRLLQDAWGRAPRKVRRQSDAQDAASEVQSVAPPPALSCPRCLKTLIGVNSHTGGIQSAREQWDDLECPSCFGRFQYRHRTGRLRRLD